LKIKCSYSEIRDIINLVPHDKNTNNHPENQIKLLAKIMKFQGWRHPIVISKLSGKIVSGHGRLQAAKLNGWETAPVDIQDFENEAEEILFLESDNNIAELSQHDKSKMIDNIKELNLEDLDFELLGLEDFSFIQDHDLLNQNLDDIESDQEPEKIYSLKVELSNEMDMHDLKDDLLSKGYIVKVL